MKTLINILQLLFRRRARGYYFLAKSLMWVSIPLISSPWWVPFISPFVEKFLKIKIEGDYIFGIGLLCLILGILAAFYAIFKDKQVVYDNTKLTELNRMLNETEFINILDTFNNNAHILKADRVRLENFFSHLRNETNKFKHPIINCQVNKLLQSQSEFETFIFNKIFDLREQTTIYYYFLPDKNIDLSEPTTDEQIDFDKQLDILSSKIKNLKKEYKNLIQIHRKWV